MALTNIIANVVLDIYDHNLTPSTIKTVALDSSSRYVAAVIRNRGGLYDIGQTAGVTLTVVRPDKTKVQITGETCANEESTPEGDTVTTYGAYAELTQLALAIKGSLKAQFKITSGEQIIRTEIFTINNGEALDDSDGDWAGELDGHNLDEMAEQIEDLSSDVSEIQEDLGNVKSGFNELPSVKDSDADTGVFDIADVQGNSILRIANGNLRTKGFDTNAQEYVNSFIFDGNSGSKTIDEFFLKGTELVFHVQNMSVVTGDIAAAYKVTYFYTDKSGTNHNLVTDYGYNYYHAILPEDASAVGVSYPSNVVSTSGTRLAFYVYAVPTYGRKPHVIHIAQDGSGDFASIRQAVESVTDSNGFNQYIFYVHKGTYDILSEYTQAEINADGFKGLYLKDGMSLIGVGARSEVILTGTLDPSLYDSTKRNAVSVLNLTGDVTVENLTVTASYIRYAIHDDTGSATHKINTRKLTNLKVYGDHMTSGSNSYSYGAGGNNLKRIIAKDCDFSSAVAIHTDANSRYSMSVYLENCSARWWSFSDYNSGLDHHYYMNNCKALMISISQSGGEHVQYLQLDGIETHNAMVYCPTGYVYNLGDCMEFINQSVGSGYAVKLTNAYGGIDVATALDDIYGISIGTRGNHTIVQTDGYINSNILGLSGLAVGDYLTIDNTGKVISGGTSANAVAKVKFVSDNVAYAKLMI